MAASQCEFISQEVPFLMSVPVFSYNLMFCLKIFFIWFDITNNVDLSAPFNHKRAKRVQVRIVCSHRYITI